MNKLIRFTTFASLVMLGGCAGIIRQTPSLGDPVAVVQQKMGAPTSVYRVGEEQLFEYATGPMGQQTYMARIGADGRLAAYEQVLTGEKFATLKIGQATRDDVLKTVGRPAERSYIAMRDWEVWSYRYKEAGVWNSMMHVHFDRQGIVQQMMNGPDPMYEPKERVGW
ncbi:outer membrane protein assembly factor BamE [Massilia sp. IC2-476]|uniref:outer membrane protein assembly factor BamE domain-containing protein n=1 Tax=Massilia sp. IC2-476 TaxID=2887199 RepID=UPI001D0FE264|nr:outer membrane protein assembly factor BamE [Massilia sp. IC2-476]MCC2970381.1 outer membrane protein assembly factor BamE [Massilia sp. IC2-476]